MQQRAQAPVLEVEDLQVRFATDEGELRVVENLSFHIDPGETLALVGESGCGKSVTALGIMGLIDAPGEIAHGSIRLQGAELVGASRAQMRAVRGRRIGMIFQEPMTSLNPVFTIGSQIAEVLEQHTKLSPPEVGEEVLRLLTTVGISSPERRQHQYPHELSGGMKQRAMIAMALACKPDLLIADEPTTALDVTIQAQILELLKRLQREMGMAILLITHNLGVVAHFAQRVVVMYAGTVAEQAPTGTLFADPLHPYTRALLRALPHPGSRGHALAAIEGSVPNPLDFPVGCRFCTRCPEALERCPDERPRLHEHGEGHRVACWLYDSPEARP